MHRRRRNTSTANKGRRKEGKKGRKRKGIERRKSSLHFPNSELAILQFLEAMQWDKRVKYKRTDFLLKETHTSYMFLF